MLFFFLPSLLSSFFPVSLPLLLLSSLPCFFLHSFLLLVRTYQINFITHQWVVACNFEKHCSLGYKNFCLFGACSLNGHNMIYNKMVSYVKTQHTLEN